MILPYFTPGFGPASRVIVRTFDLDEVEGVKKSGKLMDTIQEHLQFMRLERMPLSATFG